MDQVPDIFGRQSTQDGVDMFLSERLDRSWEQDKVLFPLAAPSRTSTAVQHEHAAAMPPGVFGDEAMTSVPWASNSTAWQGRETELALEVLYIVSHVACLLHLLRLMTATVT